MSACLHSLLSRASSAFALDYGFPNFHPNSPYWLILQILNSPKSSRFIKPTCIPWLKKLLPWSKNMPFTLHYQLNSEKYSNCQYQDLKTWHHMNQRQLNYCSAKNNWLRHQSSPCLNNHITKLFITQQRAPLLTVPKNLLKNHLWCTPPT